jgi:hypothetical protein
MDEDDVARNYVLHVVRTFKRVAPDAPLRKLYDDGVLDKACERLQGSTPGFPVTGLQQESIVREAKKILRDEITTSMTTLQEFEEGERKATSCPIAVQPLTRLFHPAVLSRQPGHQGLEFTEPKI